MPNPTLVPHAMQFGSSFKITRAEVEAVLAMTVAEAVGHAVRTKKPPSA